MTTHIVKWKDDDRRLTAYCEDDKTKTEIGPVRWNDATNQLELHCGGNVYPVKWNDAENRLEARNVAAGCCAACDDYSPPSTISVNLTNYTLCDGTPCESSCECLEGIFNLTHFQSGTYYWYFKYVIDAACDARNRYLCYDARDFEIHVSLSCTSNTWKIVASAGHGLLGNENCFYNEGSGFSVDFGEDPIVLNSGMKDENDCWGYEYHPLCYGSIMTITGLFS